MERLQVRLMHEQDWMTAEEISEMAGLPLQKVTRILAETEPAKEKPPSRATAARTERLARVAEKRRRKSQTVRAVRARKRAARQRLRGRAAELRAKGFTFKEVGAMLGVSKTTARRWLEEVNR